MYSVDKQMLIHEQKKSYNQNIKRKSKRKRKKRKHRGFFEVMRPKTKLAFLFFSLAKLSSFTVVPLFVVLYFSGYISNIWIGLIIYGTFICASVIFSILDMYSKESIPNKKSVEKWMRHYNL